MSRPAPGSIEGYLHQLRQALSGEDPALVQDALYDAEEYLRAELANHPDKGEADMLELIAGTYGAPDEVAEVYRTREATVAAALYPLRRPAKRSLAGRYFGVLVDPTAYGALFYLLLSLGTGIVYFMVTATGLMMSAALMVLIIGIPFLLLFLALVRVLSLTEGRLVEVMLGLRMPRRPPYQRA